MLARASTVAPGWRSSFAISCAERGDQNAPTAVMIAPPGVGATAIVCSPGLLRPRRESALPVISAAPATLYEAIAASDARLPRLFQLSTCSAVHGSAGTQPATRFSK